ncbi:transposon TX1 [Tanacetum coccineum]|uniref:Transposon TX1 n=1 Tax=Tanacetum coccineum TaxID=301880 RepID=A0ABQ5JDE7_9ASTR
MSKSDLRKWSKERFEGNKEKNEGYKSEAMRWELEAEKRVLNDAERAPWLEARKLWLEKENEVAGMLHQKARIKWDVKGESKFFYSFVKRRNNKNNIRGLMLNGIWSEDPRAIKMEVERYYKALFFEGMTIRPLFYCDRIEIFLDNEAAMLETEFKEKEVWEAICGCGGDKTSGPDGFNFKFMKKFWDVLKSDLMFAVKWYWDRMEISRGCNASFVTIIPKIADPIGLGDFRPISLIGCYYKIIAKILAERVKKVIGKLVAYDSINWRFLMGIMKKMGFGAKWCKWVESCLRSSTMSILVNESPTEEFSLERGVRQGDLLSPFLFILAAEGLNVIVNEAVQNGVNDREIGDMARLMRCGVGEFPFTYLGMPIGENMRRGKKIQWVKWDMLLASHGDGGLNIGSLQAKNWALLGKCGGLGGVRGVGGDLKRGWVWREIIKIGEELGELGIDFPTSFVADIGERREGWQTKEDRWKTCGNGNGIGDTWRWTLQEDGKFTVNALTKMVEERMIPVRVELDKRDIDLDSILCPRCDSVVETCEHSLVLCNFAMSVWERVYRWWKVGDVNAFSIGELFASNGNVDIPKHATRLWQVVRWTSGSDIECAAASAADVFLCEGLF